MAQNLVMRQMDERQSEHEIGLLVWSPKMDILAAAMCSGEVSLYRLQWHKVWTAPPSRENETCTNICWRPDGKLLAAGYSSGLLVIRHIESEKAIHTEELDSPITSISWHERPADFSFKDDELYSKFENSDWDFLNFLPALSKAYSLSESDWFEVEDCRKLEESSTVTLLVVGTASGSIHVLINGYLMCAKLNISDVLNGGGSIVNVVLSNDLKTLSAVIQRNESFHIVLLECSLLYGCQPELGLLASRYSIIHGTLQYMNDVIKQIKESWENILMEMDTKLSRYANANPPGTLAADFLELLMFGTLSAELQKFFFVDVKENGLKKLGKSIEMSYRNIQKLVHAYLHPVCQSITFHLGELVGHARASQKFSLLGITEEVVTEAYNNAGRFWAKSVELQQVVNESTNNFKAFFRWLYAELIRNEHGTETIPEELRRTSQQEIAFLADFLHRLENGNTTGKGGIGHIYLEMVGQYLEDRELTRPPDNSKNPWAELLEQNPRLRSIPSIIPDNTNTSLIEDYNLLTESVDNIFRGMNLDMISHTVVSMNLQVPKYPSESNFEVRCHQIVDQNVVQGVLAQEASKMLYWETSMNEDSSLKACWLKSEEDHFIIDTSFYTRDTLSVLMDTDNQQMLVQFPISSLTLCQPVLTRRRHVEPGLSSVPAIPLPDSTPKTLIVEAAGKSAFRELENIRASQFAVSGPRKVSVLLFKSKKRLRIYDMEVEEEEEDETFVSSSGLSGTADMSSY